jgi:hypothetical protein
MDILIFRLDICAIADRLRQIQSMPPPAADCEQSVRSFRSSQSRQDIEIRLSKTDDDSNMFEKSISHWHAEQFVPISTEGWK